VIVDVKGLERGIEILIARQRSLVRGSLRIYERDTPDLEVVFRTYSTTGGLQDVWGFVLSRRICKRSTGELVSAVQQGLYACGVLELTGREKLLHRLDETVKLARAGKWQEAWELGQDAIVEVGAAARGQVSWQSEVVEVEVSPDDLPTVNASSSCVWFGEPGRLPPEVEVVNLSRRAASAPDPASE
jgi:hypothetical protein